MRWLTISLILVATIGCGGSEQVAKKPVPKAPVERTEQRSEQTSNDQTASEIAASSDKAGDLAGRITLDGEIPPPRKLSINKDEKTCGVIETVQDITGKDGGIANVVIEIKGIEESDDWKWDTPKDGYVIRQKDCQFVPNMLVVPNGKEIQVFNDDPVGHNVNTGDWNKMQPAGTEPIVRPVDAKAPLKIGCNIHSWMEGWIYPAQSPFYAVTNEQGEYSIKGVPPGKYRVMIWHPALGRKTERVTLDAGKVEIINHTYTAN